MTEQTSDPDAIERDLARTRARLDDRLDALQSRLSPGQIVDELSGWLRSSQGADFARNLTDSVREKPLPVALVGIGLAWLMSSGPGRTAAAGVPSTTSAGSAQSGYDVLIARVQQTSQAMSRRPDETEGAFRSRLDDARGQVLGLSRHAQETAESFGQRVEEALSAARDRVMHGVHDLSDGVHDAAGRVGAAIGTAGDFAQQGRERAGDLLAQGASWTRNAGEWVRQSAASGAGQAGRAGSGLGTVLNDNPLILGALGMAAGALLGALLPQGRQEVEALGGAAAQLRGTVGRAAHEAADGGGRVAQAVFEAGRDSAQAHGLTSERSAGDLAGGAASGELFESARQVAQDALRAGDEGARREGLGAAPERQEGAGNTPV